MANIKAGTYRFNDVLTHIGGDNTQDFTIPIKFTCVLNLPDLNTGIVTPTIMQYVGICQEPSGLGAVGSLGYISSFDPWSNEYMCHSGITWKTNYISREIIESGYQAGEISETAYNNAIAFLESGGQIYGRDLQTITVHADTEVSDEFSAWFTANTIEMKTLKAGTYKFEELFTPINYKQEDGGTRLDKVNINFTVDPPSLGMTVHCTAICLITSNVTPTYNADKAWYFVNRIDYYLADEFAAMVGSDHVTVMTDDGWSPIFAGADVITVTEDTEVSDEFGKWFNSNVKPQGGENTTSTTITYNGATIAALGGGQSATLKCAGLKMESDVVVNMDGEAGGTVNPYLPIGVSSANEMDAIIESATSKIVGSVYKYMGESNEVYENGGFYILEAVE